MRDTSGCLSRKPGIRFNFLFLFPYLFCSIRPSPFVPVSLTPHKAMSFPSVLCLTSFMPSLLLASIIVMTLSLVYLPLVIHLSGFSKTLDHIIFLFKSHQWYPLIPGKRRTLYTKGLQALLLSDPVALTLTLSFLAFYAPTKRKVLYIPECVQLSSASLPLSVPLLASVWLSVLVRFLWNEWAFYSFCDNCGTQQWFYATWGVLLHFWSTWNVLG